MSCQGQMRQSLSVEMSYRWLEGNPNKASALGVALVASFPWFLPHLVPLAAQNISPARGSHTARVPLHNKTKQSLHPDIPTSTEVLCCSFIRRSLSELALPDPDGSEPECKEQDSACCLSPAFLRRRLVLLFTIQLPSLEGGLFYK